MREGARQDCNRAEPASLGELNLQLVLLQHVLASADQAGNLSLGVSYGNGGELHVEGAAIFPFHLQVAAKRPILKDLMPDLPVRFRGWSFRCEPAQVLPHNLDRAVSRQLFKSWVNSLQESGCVGEEHCFLAAVDALLEVAKCVCHLTVPRIARG